MLKMTRLDAESRSLKRFYCKSRSCLCALVAVILCILAASVSAQTRYVTDELVITLRTGPSTQNAIIQNLRTGDGVILLDGNAQAGFVRVRTESGVEGWALIQYLVDAPVAKTQLATAQRELSQARPRIAELEGRVAELTEQLDAVTQRLREAETAATDLNTELVDVRSASANALTIRDQNESLRRRLNERDLLFEQLTRDNTELASRANREWFMIGAGVLFAGIVLGLIIPSLRRKRRSEW